MKKYISAASKMPVIKSIPDSQEECAELVENQISIPDILKIIGFIPFENYYIAQMNNQLIIASPKDDTIYIVDPSHGDNGEEVDIPSYMTFPFYMIDQYIKSGKSDLVRFCFEDTDYFIYEHAISDQFDFSNIMYDFYYV